MKRLAILTLLLTVLPSMEDSTGAAGNNFLAALLDRVEPRRGVTVRSAVVIPLVLREGVSSREDGPGSKGQLTYQPEKKDLVKIVFNLCEPRFLPAGILLFGLGRERLLSRSVMLVPGEELVVRATCCDARDEDAPEAGEAGEGDTTFGPMAPHAQRKIDLLLKERSALVTLLRVQMALAGTGVQAKTVREMMAGKEIEERVNPARQRLSGLPSLYGGAVAGHVLFIGLRPVEFILFREPLDYARHGPRYLQAAAVSLTLWEEYYGVDPLLVKKIDDRLLIPVVEKILAGHRAARVKRARPASREKGGGDLYRITISSEDPVMKFAGRLLIEGKEQHLKQPFHLESYQDGKRVVLPSPLTKPGGRPTDAKPDVSHGAMTKEFLRRLRERMAARGR